MKLTIYNDSIKLICFLIFSPIFKLRKMLKINFKLN